MILSELRDYLEIHGRASLADMATRFSTQPDALRAMLARWQAKGKVIKLEQENTCGGCNQCAGEKAEIYVWQGDLHA